MILKKMMWTILVSMVPAVEVKGAIPFGIALGLPQAVAYASAIVGSTFVVCFLAFVTNWFYRFCKEKKIFVKFIGWMDKIALNNHEKIKKLGPLAIFVYVAIPIPGTGTWTGSIIAGVLNMKPKLIILSVLCGNLVAGLIMTIVGTGAVNVLDNIVDLPF